MVAANVEEAEVVLDVGIPMLNLKDRLQTFKKWKFPDNANCSAKKLAEAGFYFCGPRNSDVVKCFLCNKELDSWEQEDDPWAEHLKHRNTCYYAQKKKIETQLTTVEFCDLIQAFILAQLDKAEANFAQDVERLMLTCTKKLKKLGVQQ
ncbi:baculoviral IAP repeat-containing protein 5.2-B-like isoform X2 [Schistocerca americana]|uniref:baculoviral IAP repeat-containing protein 5.2-B-like isoform X2 n=1 Tax=Schistocerca americana TaxID=7009 RepID=UPI001F502264|nr:baculoviral IAP repeat-containing protein 5.2-B-like isoform X2 [Schistocerca americana]XP_047119887.1 baculoviral IAP repeat-containing protein 5.2-B-like isoform X2 [Schistocerca piceifrons]XP_049939993.1 baculoviral IAP repeat-containing protein 5.2-B isoform X1 [Schistocerca serialis cubense]